MKQRPGQVWKIFGEAVHQLARVLELLLILCILGFCLLAFRLSFGPLELPELASRMATLASGQGISVHMDGAELTWAGYHLGGGVPFAFRLRGISVRNAEGLEFVNVPAADMVAPPADIFGAHQPLRVDGSGARFTGTTAPVSVHAYIWPGKGYTLARGDFYVTLGPGVVGQPGLSESITGGSFVLHAAPSAIDITDGKLNLTPVGASAPHVGFSFTARARQNWTASLTATADAVRAEDLPSYWPELAAPHTRDWVTANITEGFARNAAFTFGLSAPEDLSSLQLDTVTGGFTAQALRLIWLKGITPLTKLDGTFTMPDRDTAVITAQAGHVAGVALTGGTMTIHGVSQKDQVGDLAVDLAASLPDAFAVLNAPPLNLLRDAPPGVADAKGSITAHVTAQIPFVQDLHLADTGLHVQGKLRKVNMVSLLPPLSFTDTSVDVDVTAQTLRLKAKGNFAGEPATVAMEEAIGTKDSPATIEMQGAAGAQLWNFLGLEQATAASGPASGVAPFTLRLSGPSGGTQTASVSSDITAASIALPEFGWAKQPGDAGHLAISARLEHGKLAAVTGLEAQAPGLDIRGTGQEGGSFTLANATIGRTRAKGSLTPPVNAGEPWRLSLSGPVLDIRRKQQSTAGNGKKGDTFSGAAWAATLNFGTAYLAAPPAPGLKDFTFTGAGLGGTVVEAQAQADGFSLGIMPQQDLRRSLTLRSDDTGTLLRALNLYGNATGGKLALDAVYGGSQPATGTATLEKLRLAKAPEVTKFLQAMTLYGVADAVSGPGMRIDHAVIPFSVQDGTLKLNGARAFSSSLGFTATGSINLADDNCSIDTTVVPLYALNALPGKLPLLGKLFSPEKGGGVFAMRAHVSGPLTDPHVAMNPLSAFTPGFLRGLFGLGGEKPTTQP
ncbi:YhdP family protein [Acidocella aromatica]|uniref:YhdP central domain-containing protein n=1 Tax=Acidocella aromatica TaxID=1303579 RepID=A0A840VQ85_9PROT|nr:DUF3971 domain-containing protein [Acidocella aromatica]MBB5372462.1 hypothetical protein [Acidocella aromatica]